MELVLSVHPSVNFLPVTSLVSHPAHIDLSNISLTILDFGLARLLTMASWTSWHETGCARPDVVLFEDSPTCISCGSVCTASCLEEFLYRGDLLVTTQSSERRDENKLLELNWPSSIAFSTLGDTDDPLQRKALIRLRRNRVGQPFIESFDAEDATQQDKATQRLGTDSETFIQDTAETIEQEQGSSSALSKESMYEVLTGAGQIRLLILSPSASGDDKPLHGNLHITRLSCRPDFTALSYTWADASGNRARSDTIFLGARWTPLAITANCAAALRQLRSEGKAVVWVDAICIDQNDTTERSHQVGLMRDIYSRASSVFIFLGNDGHEPTLDGALMSRMSEKCFYGGPSVQLFWESSRDLEGLKALFERPYWSRLWVIQEVLLSKQAVVVLNDKSVPLSTLLGNRPLDVKYGSYFPAWTQLIGSSVRDYGDPVAVSELMLKTSSCHASDARDRIFALLGLVRGAHLEGMDPDYTKTVTELYIGIAAYFLIRHGQSKILKWAATSKGPGPTTGWLSWVPTWTSSPVPSEYPEATKPHPRDSFWLSLAPHGILVPDDNIQCWDEVTPDHACRRSNSSEHRSPGDVTRLLRPRVFQGSGALLIRAYPILHLNSMYLGSAFERSLTPSESKMGLLRLITPLERDSQPCNARWGIYLASDDDKCRDTEDDWIVEVPNCDELIHLKPVRGLPGVHRIAATCRLILAADVPLEPLLSVQGHTYYDDYMLTLRLLALKPYQILFMKSWERLMDGNVALQPTADLRSGLSPMYMMQYGMWLASLKQWSDEVWEDFQPALQAVSCYLDGWVDLVLWDNICDFLEMTDWQQLVRSLDDLKKDTVSETNNDPVEPNHTQASQRQTRDTHLRDQLNVRMNHLMHAVDQLGLPGLTGKTVRLGRFELAGVATMLCKVVDDRPEVRAHNTAVWRDWDEFTAHLRHLHHARGECRAIRDKFVQRQVLRRLFTRVEPWEFLIS